MRKGRIVQLADPRTIYDAPGDPFVAAFIGASNVIDGEVMAADDRGGVEVALRGGARLHGRARVAVMPGDPVSVAVRPEHNRLSDPLAGGLCAGNRSEEHTSELPSLRRISSAVFCLNK